MGLSKAELPKNHIRARSTEPKQWLTNYFKGTRVGFVKGRITTTHTTVRLSSRGQKKGKKR